MSSPRLSELLLSTLGVSFLKDTRASGLSHCWTERPRWAALLGEVLQTGLEKPTRPKPSLLKKHVFDRLGVSGDSCHVVNIRRRSRMKGPRLVCVPGLRAGL